MTDPRAQETQDEPLRWAGHGHVGAFLLQLTILIVVKLALWGFIFLIALKFSGVLGGEPS